MYRILSLTLKRCLKIPYKSDSYLFVSELFNVFIFNLSVMNDNCYIIFRYCLIFWFCGTVDILKSRGFI